jgi:hypothetical protein
LGRRRLRERNTKRRWQKLGRSWFFGLLWTWFSSPPGHEIQPYL